MADLKQIYKQVYLPLVKSGLLDRTLVTIENRDIPFLAKTKGKTSVSYKNAVDTLNAGLAVRDAVRKGGDSKVPVKGLNMLGEAVSKQLDMERLTSARVRATGTPNNPGITASVPVGQRREVGLVMPDFGNLDTARGYYKDPETRIDVDRSGISGRRNLGKAGPFHMSIEGGVTKRGDTRAMLRGRMPLAKGGKVKKYAKGGGVRKPKLK
tara:strand:- start:97 stop:726 length:630 start_codon:yes stop_codon:yes gene_type:complete